MSNDNYPDGLANHPDAPWNQKDPREGYGEIHAEMVCEDLFDTGPGEEFLIKVTQLMTEELMADQMMSKRIRKELRRAFSKAAGELADLAHELALEDPEFQNPEPYYDE